MKKTAWALVALFLAALPFIVRAADESKTLTGEPVDITCYLGGKSGEQHGATCGKSCIAKGMPAGLVVKEGDKSQLYLILAGHDKKVADVLGDLVGKQAKVTGKVAEKDGLKTITIEKAEAAK